MSKTEPLRKNYEFANVYRRGRYSSGEYIVLHYLKQRKRKLRIGITVSKGIKGAVKRNRYKRLLRIAFRTYKEQITSTYDIILLAKTKTESYGYHEIMNELPILIKKAGIIKNKSNENN